MKRAFCLVVLAFGPIQAAKMIRFASPLQSLTIPDKEIKEQLSTKRSRFLPRFRAGLQAEVEKRREISSERTTEIQSAAASGDSNWAQRATMAERTRRAKEDTAVEDAFDKAVSAFDKQSKKAKPPTPQNSYQFVGVVNKKSDKPITWYARPKPTNSKWSVRLLHVNQDAIIKDLFNEGKVDIFAKYRNTGKVDETTNTPIVNASYEVRERSWKNLWNFSPKHMFTDSSGMYWRERRVQPGLYTDGVSVYESSYRYNDGRNGMYRVSAFGQFLNSKTIKPEQKETILKRLQDDTPDVVLEL